MRLAISPAAITASLLSRATAPMAFGDGESQDDNQEQEQEEEEGEADGEAAKAEAAAQSEAAAVEAQARAQGWRPEAEFKGEGKWVDAATFVERGNKFKKNLEKQVADLTKQVADQKKTGEAFAKFHKEAMDRKDAELTEAIRKAKLDRSEAIRNGNDEDALALDDRIDTLKDEKAKLKAEPAKEEPVKEEPSEEAAENATLLAWVEDGNTWFRDDPKLRAYAMAIGQEMRAAGDKTRDRTFLDKIRAQMEEDMPDRFAKGNPLRRKAGSVEAGNSGSQQQQQGKTERDLPKQDRELMKKFVADGLLTKEQFLKDYNWS